MRKPYGKGDNSSIKYIKAPKFGGPEVLKLVEADTPGRFKGDSNRRDYPGTNLGAGARRGVGGQSIWMRLL
jgi:hypothetical protein